MPETKVFLGRDPVGYKIVMDNKFLKKVQNFKYFGSEVSYENGKDIQQKIKFVQILVITVYSDFTTTVTTGHAMTTINCCF